MEKSLPNFMLPSEELLGAFSDSGGRTFGQRIERLDKALDVCWFRPNDGAILQLFHARFAKFVRLVNENPILPIQIELRFDRDLNPQTSQENRCALLDDLDPQASLAAIEKLMTGPVKPGVPREVRNVIWTALLDWLLIQLLRRLGGRTADQDAATARKLAQLISDSKDEPLQGTNFLERLNACECMQDIASLTLADGAKAEVLWARAQNNSFRHFLHKGLMLRLRILDLYQRVLPLLDSHTGSSSQPEMLNNLDLLLDYICALDSLPQLNEEQRERLRHEVAAPLVRAIANTTDEIGWHIYRGLRDRGGKAHFRTDFLFEKLLENDDERVAVLNRIFLHKRMEIGPGHPEYSRLPELTLSKYQPHFENKLLYNSSNRTFSVEKSAVSTQD